MSKIELSPAARAVFFGIVAGNYSPHPGTGHLADYLGLTDGGYQKACRELTEAGYLKGMIPTIAVEMPDLLPKESEMIQMFDKFWALYPRKVGKPVAFLKFKAMFKRGYDVDRIMTGLEAWKKYWSAQGTKIDFLPHPATWLNGERFNDRPGGELSGTQRSDDLDALMAKRHG